jgi:hypothetical protein
MKRVCLALLVVIAVTFPLAAQDPTSFEEGFVPYQTYRASDFDSVNMLTGNVVITIPIISYPQRGTLPDLSQSFVVNAPDWEYVCVDDGMGGQVCNWQVPSADYAYPYSVSRFGNFVRDNFLAGTLSPLPYPESGAVFFAYDATGALHVGTFFVANSNRLGTDDASGITGAYVPNSPFDMWYPIDRNGIQFRWAHYDSNRNVLSYPRTIDPSGNTITELAGGGWTDSIGRTIPSLAAIPRGTPGCTTKYFPGPPSNDPVHVTVCYSAFTNRSII